MAIGVLALLAVMVTVAVTVTSGGPGDSALPDVGGQPLPDAITLLDNRGLITRVQEKVHPTVPADHVIDTEPAADTAVGPGDEITINVSTGPAPKPPDAALRVVPDVSSLTYAEAIRVLLGAGFLQFQQASLPSSPELKDRVLGTNPFANRTVESTAKITVVMGSGPASDNP